MWYVMQVQTGNEEIVIQLCEQMVDSSKYKHIFSPKCVTLKKYQGEWRELIRPLFPGYIFIDTDESCITDFPVCRHYYSDLAFQQDMQVDETPYGKIRVYDIERSVCDCIRFRADIGEDMLHLIISNFLQRNSNQMDRLLAYADAMRVGKIVRTHLKQNE